MIYRIGNAMMFLGSVAFVSATAWWIVFFYEILGDNFQKARDCFYWTSEICTLKEAAPLLTNVPVYNPVLMWAGAAMFLIGVGFRVAGIAED